MKDMAQELFEAAAQAKMGAQDPAAGWAAYLEQLRQSDPEEYELLVKDMEGFVAAKQRADEVVTPASAPQDDAAVNPAGPGAASPEFNPRLPGGKRLGKGGVEEAEESEGVQVVPEPGFVIKTRSEKGEKVFVNICQSDTIQKTSKKKQLAEDGTEQEGINIPLSLGPPRAERDKAGAACVVFDIIVHPEVVQNAADDKTGAARSFLCELALQYVEQKYKYTVDYQYKVPKLKYKGDANAIPPQMIRKRHKPVIEEVTESAATPSPLSAAAATQRQPAKKRAIKPLAYSLLQRTDCGLAPAAAALSEPMPAEAAGSDRLPSELVLRVALDLAANDPELLSRVRLKASAELLALQVDGYYQPLEIFLPVPIQEAEAQASFDPETLQLEVRLPALPISEQAWRSSTEPDPGSRPWLLARALQDGTSGSSEGGAVAGPAPEPAEKTAAHEPPPASEDDTLPEDRFHLADMLSQHIKDERERERREKLERHEEEERAKKAEEERVAKQERADAVAKLLAQAEEELRASGKTSLNEADDDDDDDDDDGDMLV